MNEHDRPTVETSRGPFTRPAAPWGAWLAPWQMWCIVAAAIGAAGGVGFAGAMMSTKQTMACMKAEEASHQEKGRLMDLEFAMRREQERKENDEATRHLQAIRECHKEGNIPVLGFNYTVVCMARSHISWAHSMEDPITWL